MLFIFDENYPPAFVEGFKILETANKKSPFSVQVVFSVDFMGGVRFDKNGRRVSIPDEEIIVKADQKNAVIITHDSDFKRIKHYKALLVKHKVGYIYFKVPSGKYTYWEIVKAFIIKWEEIKEQISKASHPFAFEIDKNGRLKTNSF